MRRFFAAAMGIAVATALSAQAVDPEISTEKPFHDFQQEKLVYSGPIDEIADLTNLEQVAIGWFGPDDPDHPLHGDLWVAASMAVEEANAAGGYRGLPFSLLARWSENPWGSGVAEVARLAYEDNVWALLGSVDGPGTHLAEQVVAKARLPLVSPVSTDVSVNLAGVPWMFSLAPSDTIWAGALIDRLLDEIGTSNFVLLAGTDHDSRLATQSILAELARRGRGPALRANLSPSSEQPSSELARWIADHPAAVLVVAGPRHSAQLVLDLHEAGFEGVVFGTPQMGRSVFLRRIESIESWIVFPDLWPSSAEAEAFVTRFQQRTERAPDWATAHTYDATRLLLAAIDQAGLNRSRIRDQLAAAPSWEGVTGLIDWSPTGQNRREAGATTEIRPAGNFKRKARTPGPCSSLSE